MPIPAEYIAEVTRRTDITELVRSYVELKRAGRLERGLCPFHNEKTPSFYVYPDSDSFYCFGCAAGGDAITFVKRMLNLDYPEAVRFLAARAGMPLPDEDDDSSRLRGRLLAINRETARFYVDALNREEGRAARAYLRGRNLDDKTIRRFGLGFAPDDFGRLRSHLKSLGYAEEELLQAGVAKQGKNNSIYDAFRARVMFPIIDLRGNVIAFGGRAMGDGFGPKYLNTAGTPIFNKSRNLFALGFAKKSPSRRYLLAEGYMDVISLHQAGFDTAVATLGTALTAEQAKIISNYADEVVICYDGDEAGQKATARAIEILGTTPVKVRVLALQDAKDPDEYISRYGPQKFEQLLEGSGNTIEYNLLKTRQRFDLTTPDGRAAYAAAALEVLAAASPVEQDIYAGRVAQETDVAKAKLLSQLEGVLRRRESRLAKERQQRFKKEGAAAAINLPPSAGGQALGVAYAEQQLMAALLKHPEDYLPMVREALAPEQFITPEMQGAYKLVLEREQEVRLAGLSALTDALDDKALSVLGRALAASNEAGVSKEDVEMYIRRVREGDANPAKAAGMSADELQDMIRGMGDKHG